MPITDKQLARRVNHIGSSDVAAILGKSPWANAYDVWLQKTGRVVENTTAPWMEAGSYIEGGMLNWAAKQLGSLVRNQYRSRPDLHLGCHIDAILNETGEPVEGKSLGAFGTRAELFGEPGTDQIPDDVILQCHAHMIVLGSRLGTSIRTAHIPVLRASLQFVMYVVEWDEGLADTIKEACAWFWNLVERDIPPPDTVPHLDMLKQRIRKPQVTVEVDPSLVSRWRASKGWLNGAEKSEQACRAELLAAMGDGDAAEGGAAGLVTFYERKGADRPDRERMKADGIWDKYAIKGKAYRVPVLRAPTNRQLTGETNAQPDDGSDHCATKQP